VSRLIILEGARGLGKSTLSFKLRQKLKHSTLINFTGFHDDGEKGLHKISNYYIEWFTLFRKFYACLDDYTIICDRFFPSEMVFSSLYKKYNFEDKYKLYCKLLPTIADEIILFHFTINDENELAQRLIRDKVPFGKVEESVAETLKQQEEYKKQIDLLNAIVKWNYDKLVKVIEIDTTGKSIDELLKELMVHITSENYEQNN
jgi:deoxyguanosine kinase